MTMTGPGRRGGLSEADQAQRRSRALRLGEIHVVRFVPGTSLLHRMWAGTKLIALGALSIGLLLWPSWQSIGIMAVLLLVAFLLARLPRGISPRLPWWLGGMLVVGAALALVAGGKPTEHLGSLKIGLGGLDNFAKFTMVGIDVLAAAALLGWTTPLADLSPALGRLLGPLRRMRVPVDELVGAIALSIRCLPLLLEEARVLRAARRARRPASPRTVRELGDEAVEGVFGALANAIRRAREIAEAIEARGGVPTVAPETHRFARIDALSLALSALAVAAMALVR
ncbi:MAG: energy-coupling factor transporter transmembrane protein EcfT [Acidimicrobiales bacterium]